MASVARRRSAQREAYWVGTVQAWRYSGLSGKAYCKRQGLSYWTFRWWKRELGRRGKRPDPGSGQGSPVEEPCDPSQVPFLPITVVSTSRAVLMLSVSDRYRVEIPRGFDSETLERVLSILEQRAC